MKLSWPKLWAEGPSWPSSISSRLIRFVPVHPEDRWLLGMQREEHTLVDGALPLGLRSVPKIFTALADALQWIMEREGVSIVVHNLDEFLFLGPPDSPVCTQNLTRVT